MEHRFFIMYGSEALNRGIISRWQHQLLVAFYKDLTEEDPTSFGPTAVLRCLERVDDDGRISGVQRGWLLRLLHELGGKNPEHAATT